MDAVNRRSFLKATGSAGLVSETAFAFSPNTNSIIEELAGPGIDLEAKPNYSIKFAVIGLDHYHIMGMTAAVRRGGGQLVSV